MTISPTAVPIPISVAAAVTGTVSAAAGSTDFAALVEQHLSEDSERGSDASSSEAAAMLEGASLLLVVPSDGLPAPVTDRVGGAPPAGASGGGTAGTVAVADTPTAVAAPGTFRAAVTSGAGVARGLAEPTPEGTAAGVLPPPAGEPIPAEGGGSPAGPDGAPTAGPAEGGPRAGATGQVAGPEAATSGRPGPASGPPGAAGLLPAPGVGAMAVDAAPGGTGPAAPAAGAVTDQVFGRVTRLVSRGDGTHRLTLRLHPADLGEVRVVLTAKDGTVDVTLSAGVAAREALHHGSPQLRALLELAGATTGLVTVRDLATGAVAPTTSGPPTGSTAGGRADHPGGAAGDAAMAGGAPGHGHDDRAGRGTSGTRFTDLGERPGSRTDGHPGTAAGSPVMTRPATRSRLDLDL